MLISLNTLQTSPEPARIGDVIYGIVGDKPGYAIVVKAPRRGSTSNLLLHSQGDKLILSMAESTISRRGAVVVCTANDLLLRISRMSNSGGEKERKYFGRLNVDGEVRMIVAEMTGKAATPIFIDASGWGCILDDEVDASGRFWSTEWELVRVDQHGNETVIVKSSVTE